METTTTLQATEMTLAEDKQPGVMVGSFFDLPEGMPQDAHMTISYLGDISQYGDESKNAMVGAVIKASKAMPAFTVRNNGPAIFTDKGRYVVVSLLDSPMLPVLHHLVSSSLEDMGITPNSEHGFIPHMTHGFYESRELALDSFLKVLDLEVQDIHISDITVAYGRDRHTFKLQEG